MGCAISGSVNYVISDDKSQNGISLPAHMRENSMVSPHETDDSATNLLRLLEECEVQSLVAAFSGLRGGIEDPRMRELAHEIILTSLSETTQIVQAIRTILGVTPNGEGE